MDVDGVFMALKPWTPDATTRYLPPAICQEDLGIGLELHLDVVHDLLIERGELTHSGELEGALNRRGEPLLVAGVGDNGAGCRGSTDGRLPPDLEEARPHQELPKKPDVLGDDPSDTLTLDVVPRAAVDTHHSWDEDALGLLPRRQIEAEHVVDAQGVEAHRTTSEADGRALADDVRFDGSLLRDVDLGTLVVGPVVATDWGSGEETLGKRCVQRPHHEERVVLEAMLREPVAWTCLCSSRGHVSTR